MDRAKSEPIQETDVSTIRQLISENTGYAEGIKSKAESLHSTEKASPEKSDPDVPGRVGLELIDALREMRATLIDANDALIGFNG